MKSGSTIGTDTAASLPRVSIICIFYQAERWLEEAIGSILAQDHADWELLLVDDGSRDGGSQIAQGFAARHPGQMFNLAHPGHENRGMSAARNLGLAHARGEYIAFIDADDRWRPHKLREQVAVLDAHREVGLVCGALNHWLSWSGGEDRLVPTGHVSDAAASAPETLLALYPLGIAAAPAPSDILVRRKLVAEVGGFEDEFTDLYEDQAFAVKMFLHAPAFFSGSTWVDYRQHDDASVSRAHRSGTYRSKRATFLKWYRTYVLQRNFVGKSRVLRALDREEWKLRHPLAAKLVTRWQSLELAWRYRS